MGDFVSETVGLPPVGDVAEGFTGVAGANAALDAARSQAALGREGLEDVLASQARLEETLAPFMGVGVNLLGSPYFGSNAASQISGDPAFQAALEDQQTRVLAQQAARGRLGTDETRGLLGSVSGRLGSDFISRQRGDALAGIQLGQSSAAQQASSGLNTGRNASDILAQIGNVTAAGGVGAANSLGQGAQNVTGLLGTIASLFASERRFKRNIEMTGISSSGVKMYKYQYTWSDTWHTGAMVDENPHAVVDCGAYKALDYARL